MYLSVKPSLANVVNQASEELIGHYCLIIVEVFEYSLILAMKRPRLDASSESQLLDIHFIVRLEALRLFNNQSNEQEASGLYI